MKEYKRIQYEEFKIKLKETNDDRVRIKRNHFQYLNYVFSNHLQIQDDIINEANTILDQMQGFFIIGVHSRTLHHKKLEQNGSIDHIKIVEQ